MNDNVFRILYLILILLNLFTAFHGKFDALNFIAALFTLMCWGYMEWMITNEK
jgi:hypothetical protein